MVINGYGILVGSQHYNAKVDLNADGAIDINDNILHLKKRVRAIIYS